MKSIVLVLCMVTVCSLLCGASLTEDLMNQKVSVVKPETRPDPELESILLDLIPDYQSSYSPEEPARYFYNRVDLNGDGKQEVIVIVYGGTVCGSGGCNAWVLTPAGETYQKVTEFTLAQMPIVVGNTKTKGWNDLVFRVSGGGVIPAFHVLRFNGKKYPSNPSTAPKFTGKIDGTAYLGEDDAFHGISLIPSDED